MADRLVMARLVRREDAGRDFDIEFWQTLGAAKKSVFEKFMRL